VATRRLTVDIVADDRTSAVFGKVGREADNMGRQFGRASTASGRLQRSHESLSRSTTSLGGSLRSAAKYAAGAAAAYVGIGQAEQAVSTTTDLAKVTLGLHKNLGLSVKTASEFGAQLKVRGADAKQAQMAFATFAGVLHQAAGGSATAKSELAELGITGKILGRDLKDPQKALFDVSEGLNNLGEGISKTDLQRKLFGRGWQTLGPILRGGSKDLKDQLDLADQMGASFGGKSLTSIQDLIEEQRKMQLAMLGLQISFTENVEPSLIKMFQLFGNVSNAVRTMSPEVRGALAIGAAGVGTLLFLGKLAGAWRAVAGAAGAAATTEEGAAAVSTVAGAAGGGGARALREADRAAVGGGAAAGGVTAAEKVGIGGGAAAAAKAFGTKLGIGIIGAADIYVATHFDQVGNRIDPQNAFGPIAQTTVESFQKSLDDAFHTEAGTGSGQLSKGRVWVATAFGNLVFNSQTRKVVGTKSEQLKGLIGHSVEDASKSLEKWTTRKLPDEATRFTDSMGLMSRVSKSHLKSLSSSAKFEMGKVRDAVQSGDDPTKQFSASFTAMIDHVQKAMKQGSISVSQGTAIINKILKQEFTDLGIPDLFQTTQQAAAQHQGTLARQGKPHKKGAQQGAVLVAGSGSGDTVPLHVGGEHVANVEPRELVSVTNREATSALMAWNSAVPRFAGGGLPTWSGRGAMGAMAARALDLESTAAMHLLSQARSKRGGGGSAGASGDLGSVIANANRMNAMHRPYLWGGGHGATASVSGPWDCSGAVSELLAGSVDPGFAPRVSGGFTGLFQAGKGDFSILANAEHVYSVIGGKAWGTSESNPGGGAGWISGYTYRPGFTIRHVPLDGTGRGARGGARGRGQKQKKGFQKGGQVVGASTYGGPHDPSSGTVGASGTDLRGKMAFAELDMGHALGGLPMHSKLRITHGGRSVVAEKLDIGAGGGSVDGHHRSIDLWYQTAHALGLGDVWLGTVKVNRNTRAGASGSSGSGPKSSARRDLPGYPNRPACHRRLSALRPRLRRRQHGDRGRPRRGEERGEHARRG
jgi:hypothetical protein